MNYDTAIMFKKIIILVAILFISFIQKAQAFELLKINSVNFDNSDNLIFITMLAAEKNPNAEVKTKLMENPKRVYFDIENAILTMPNKTFELKNSKILQFRLSQFTISPHIVRGVIYLSEGDNPDGIKVFRFNNNIIIKYNNEPNQASYFNQVYFEKPLTPTLYEKTRIQEEERQEQPKLAVPPNVRQDSLNVDLDMFDQIQKAIEGDAPTQKNQVKPQGAASSVENSERTQRLWSKYYVNRVDVKQGNVLLNGAGLVSFENPVYLVNPNRIVFDLPNTVVSPQYRNREIKISDTEFLKIGQFEPAKARLVISTDQPQKYRLIYSFDLQSFLIAHDDRIIGLKLFDKSADLVSSRIENPNDRTSLMYLNFSTSVIHSIKKDLANNRLEISLYNISNFVEEEFKNTLKTSNFENIKIEKLPYVGLKFVIPIDRNSNVDYWQSQDAKKLIFKLANFKRDTKDQGSIIAANPQKFSKNLVILDPGHGGADTGAMRGDILEKDITLDVSKRVAQILAKNGVQVEMTRWEDKTVSLSERVDISNTKSPICFVSIHVNSSVKDAITGVEMHYYHDSSYKLALMVHKNMVANLNSNDRGLFRSKFYVINHTQVPAVLVEMGFISNPEERKQMLSDSRKQKTAEAIAQGVLQYINAQK